MSRQDTNPDEAVAEMIDVLAASKSEGTRK